MTEDICLNKHGGDPQSNAANLKVDKTSDRDIILEYLRVHKTGTLKELARYMGKEKNEISGRFTELKSDEFKKIREVLDEHGEVLKREGCAVYELDEDKLTLF